MTGIMHAYAKGERQILGVCVCRFESCRMYMEKFNEQATEKFRKQFDKKGKFKGVDLNKGSNPNPDDMKIVKKD